MSRTSCLRLAPSEQVPHRGRYLIALAINPASEGLALVDVETLPIERVWQLVWRTDRRLGSAPRAFIDYVRSNAGGG